MFSKLWKRGLTLALACAMLLSMAAVAEAPEPPVEELAESAIEGPISLKEEPMAYAAAADDAIEGPVDMIPEAPVGEVAAVELGENEPSPEAEVEYNTPSEGEMLIALESYEDSTGLPISSKNFPDSKFQTYVRQTLDQNGDKKLSASEIAAVEQIDCSNLGIASLKGIERFTALRELYCYGNELTSLDISKNTELVRLCCDDNSLTALNITKNTKLTFVSCYHNLLKKLDVTKCPALVDACLFGTKKVVDDMVTIEFPQSTDGILIDGLVTDKGVKIVNKTYLVKSITLNKSSVSIKAGKTYKLKVKEILPGNATNKTVKWESSSTAIAKVSASGVVTAVKPGTATITVTAQDGSNVKATCTVTVKAVLASGVKLTPSNKLSLNAGDTYVLKATVSPSNATNKKVNWTSDNEAIATVSEEGIVTAVSPGTATITATTADSSNKKASIKVKVYPGKPVINSVNFTGINSVTVGWSAVVGAKSYIVCYGRDDNKARHISREYDASVTSCNLGGLAYNTKYFIFIRATSDVGSVDSETTTFTTLPPKPTGVALNRTKITVTLGKSKLSYTLKATVSPSDAIQAVTWKSSNTSVATVDRHGHVTIVGEDNGKAIITATAVNGVSAECTITVKKQKAAPDSVKLNRHTIQFVYGKDELSYQLKATASPSTADQTLIWSSSDDEVAMVSRQGVVTVKGTGTATITVKSMDGTKSDTCVVVVIDPRYY